MGSAVTSTGDLYRPDVSSMGVVSFTGNVDMTQSVNVLDLETHVEGVGAGTASFAGEPAVDF